MLGYLDDVLLVPLGILLALRLIPGHLVQEFRQEALRRERPASGLGAALVVLGWLCAAALLAWLFWPTSPG